MLAEEEKLLDQVDSVDYDVDSMFLPLSLLKLVEYALRLDEILATKIEKLQQLRGLHLLIITS